MSQDTLEHMLLEELNHSLSIEMLLLQEFHNKIKEIENIHCRLVLQQQHSTDTRNSLEVIAKTQTEIEANSKNSQEIH